MTTKSTTDLILKIFQVINLDERHVAIYENLLELGNIPITKLAKITGIARSTIYELIEDLVKQGLIIETKSYKRSEYSPVEPSKLKEILEERSNKINSSLVQTYQELPMLQAVYNSNKASFPKMQFFEGENGLKSALYDSLQAKMILITCQGNPKAQTGLEHDPKYLKDFIEQTILRTIPTKEILQDTPASREYKRKYSSKIHNILLTPEDKNISFDHVDKHIYENKVAYFSHDKLVAVIIEDETIAAAERQQFKALWDYYLSLKTFSV